MQSADATEAVRRGFAHATGLFPATLLLFLIEAVDLTAGMLALVSIVAGFLHFSAPLAFSGLFAVATIWLLVQLLRPLLIAGALRQGATFVRTGSAPAFPLAMAEEAGRGAAFFAYSLYAGALIGMFNALSLGSMIFAFFALIGTGRGVAGSFGLALAIVVALALSFFGRLWLKVGLVRAVLTRQPILPSLFDAVGRLGRDPLRPAGIILVLGFFAALVEAAVASAFVRLAQGIHPVEVALSNEALLLSFGAPIAGALVAALPSAWFLHAQWQSLLVLQLTQDGELPSRRAEERPKLTEEEEPIIPALPV